MTASQVLSGDSRVMQTITRYLENLRSNIDGDELHGIIARTLRRHSRNGPLGPDYLIDLYGQLDAYARDALTLPSMRIRARLLQQHIAPYISDMRMEVLPETVETIEAAPAPEPIHPSISEVPAPKTKRKEEAVIATESPATSGSTLPASTSSAAVVDMSIAEAPVEGVLERAGEQEEAAEQKSADKYQALLRSEKDAWQAIYGTVKDYQRLKEAWLKSLDEISRQRDSLEEKLTHTNAELSKLEAEREQLRTELQSARTTEPPAKRSRPLTIPRLLSKASTRSAALPKRDGFVRSLEAEIKRIKRSGAPLALGLIGIDNLDVLVERHGAEAAAAALRCYTEEVLSNFRAYDLVGVFDHDQFIVMFPDTPKEGARRALEKAYKRAVETHVNYGGQSIPLPPFAGALITYSAGEDPANFLGRAGHALQNVRASSQHGVILS